MEISETVAQQSLISFVDAIIEGFEKEYLRDPTEADVRRLLTMHERRGFPGMLGSIDCMHWQWKNCPVSLAGQYKGKEKKPTVVLEAWASQDLWIWHCNFGAAGSNNDLNILDQSPVFQSIMQGSAPKIQFTLNGRQYYMSYLLADGIYPEWAAFVKTIEKSQRRDTKLFAAKQEGRRKDVERAFGVLQSRWHILSIPCRLWRVVDMNRIMKACIILHNMIIEDKASVDHDEEQFWNDPNNHNQGFMPSFEVSRPINNRPRSLASLITTISQIQSQGIHNQLQHDLVQHIWRLHGTDE